MLTAFILANSHKILHNNGTRAKLFFNTMILGNSLKLQPSLVVTVNVLDLCVFTHCMACYLFHSMSALSHTDNEENKRSKFHFRFSSHLKPKIENNTDVKWL